MERELWVRAEPSGLKEGRDFAARAAQAFGFDQERSHEFRSATNEALANAIEHGAPWQAGKILLRVIDDGHTLSAYVCDGGRFDADLADLPRWPERGRGLALISALMDEVELTPSDEGTVVRLSKHRPLAEPGSG